MASIFLIDKTKIDTYVTTSQALSWEKLKKFVLEAQEVELKQAMCREFYFDVLKKRAEADYVKLLDGDTYTVDGIEFNFLGLNACLAHFAYARYVLEGHVIDTAFNLSQKTSDYTEPIGSNERKQLAISHQNSAHRYYEEVKHYLDYITENYPTKFTAYQDCCKPKSQNITGLKSDVL
jgi:hypothetical protein